MYFKNKKLRVTQDKVLRGEYKKETLYLEVVLSIKGHICVPRFKELVRLIIKEANFSMYYIHLVVFIMYRLRKNY